MVLKKKKLFNGPSDSFWNNETIGSEADINRNDYYSTMNFPGAR